MVEQPPATTERYLGHPNETSNSRKNSGYGSRRSCHRQLASSLRLNQAPRARRPPWQVRIITSNGDAAETQRPVQFEITEQTQSSFAAWIHQGQLRSKDCLFPSRLHTSEDLSTRQYARIAKGWVKAVVLDPPIYVIHTIRHTKASLIYRRTNNLRATQLLLDQAKLQSNVRYLGIEVDDALETAEQAEV